MQDSLSIGGKNISYKTAVILGLLGICMIAISSFLGSDTAAKVGVEEQIEESEMSEYISETEKRISDILSLIDGVGEAKIMITLESGNEYVYAKDEQYSPSEFGDMTESKYILLNGSDGEEPLILRELTPKIQGVVVVCRGGDNPYVTQKVSEVLSTALGVSYLQISVQKLVT